MTSEREASPTISITFKFSTSSVETFHISLKNFLKRSLSSMVIPVGTTNSRFSSKPPPVKFAEPAQISKPLLAKSNKYSFIWKPRSRNILKSKTSSLYSSLINSNVSSLRMRASFLSASKTSFVPFFVSGPMTSLNSFRSLFSCKFFSKGYNFWNPSKKKKPTAI